VSGEDRFLELAPLAALDALDPAEAREFAEHARGCDDCRRELAAFTAVSGGLALEVAPVAPPPRLRQRVLGAVGLVPATSTAPRPRAPAEAAWPTSRWPLTLAASLAAALGVALLSMTARNAAEQRRADELERRLREQQAVQEMMADPGAHTVALAGLPAAPRAGGRVVWSTQRKRAVLMASGLAPAPPGQVYEVWVIAGAAPVPSGLFHVDAGGRATLELPWLSATESVKTFAVTLEPEGGRPSPTGAMVLAGSAG